jgi:uncharacterized protein YodC (DUF2158 family)
LHCTGPKAERLPKSNRSGALSQSRNRALSRAIAAASSARVAPAQVAGGPPAHVLPQPSAPGYGSRRCGCRALGETQYSAWHKLPVVRRSSRPAKLLLVASPQLIDQAAPMIPARQPEVPPFCCRERGRLSLMAEDVGLRVGDTVTLRSGGHLMTVAAIDDEGSVTCDWSVRGDVKSKSFPAAELQKASLPGAKPTTDVSRLTQEQRNQLRELLRAMQGDNGEPKSR